MPVIGRLDKQVDDILITPVGEKSSREEARDDPRRGDGRERADPRATHAREPVEREHDASERGEYGRGEYEREERRSRDDEPLPVWLL